MREQPTTSSFFFPFLFFHSPPLSSHNVSHLLPPSFLPIPDKEGSDGVLDCDEISRTTAHTTSSRQVKPQPFCSNNKTLNFRSGLGASPLFLHHIVYTERQHTLCRDDRLFSCNPPRIPFSVPSVHSQRPKFHAPSKLIVVLRAPCKTFPYSIGIPVQKVRCKNAAGNPPHYEFSGAAYVLPLFSPPCILRFLQISLKSLGT